MVRSRKLPRRQETGATKTKDYKRCQNRSWELVYDSPNFKLDEALSVLCSKTFGVYKAFAIRHKKDELNNHVHIGLIFRDKPQSRKFTWDPASLKDYFSVGDDKPTLHSQLKCKKRDLGAKLQQYFDYCSDQEQHPDEDLSERAFHKWTPATEEDKSSPADLLALKIRTGLTVEELEDMIDDPETPIKLYKEALRNFDIYEKMILKHDEIRAKRARRKQYQDDVKTYRPFQKELTYRLDHQNDRNIHNHHDGGCTGKNWWLDKEAKRRDTLILQNAKTKNIAEAWDPRVHKRIIFDIPRGGAEFINFRAIESLKNGCIFSEKYRSKPKQSSFKPAIVVLTNEPLSELAVLNWTSDRLTSSTTSFADNYEFIEL